MGKRQSSVPTVGLPFNVGIDTPDAAIHGANVAVSDALKMIVRHSRFPRVRVFVSAGRAIEPIAQRLGRIRPLTDAGPGLSIETPPALPSLLGRLDAWHCVSGSGTRGRHLRAVVGGRFPVTAVHHSFAANSELHDWVLRMLLEDARPYDSQIATSRANQRATRRSILHVRRALEQQLGSPLPYRGRVDRIPLGVDTGVFRPRDKAEVRHELGLPLDELVLLWLGRLSAAGKADLIPTLNVVAEVMHRSRQRIRLIVAGVDHEGYGATVQAHATALGIADRVWLETPVVPLQRHLWHAAADVFVSPADSMQETFGLTCIEAMACGVPQLVSDWDGYRDTVIDGVTGYLAPTTWIAADRDLGMMAALGEWSRDHFALAQSVVVDMDVLRERLLALVEDEKLRRRLGDASRARAVACFDWATVIESYDALWTELGAIASATRDRSRARGTYAISRYVEAFGGNATRLLDANARIVLSDRGRRVVEGKEGLPEYFKGSFRLDYDLIEDALLALGSRGKSIARIAAAIAKGRKIHPDAAVRHVMWLLKYDLARLVGPTP